MPGEPVTDRYGFSNVLWPLHSFNVKWRMGENLCKKKNKRNIQIGEDKFSLDSQTDMK